MGTMRSGLSEAVEAKYRNVSSLVVTRPLELQSNIFISPYGSEMSTEGDSVLMITVWVT